MHCDKGDGDDGDDGNDRPSILSNPDAVFLALFNDLNFGADFIRLGNQGRVVPGEFVE